MNGIPDLEAMGLLKLIEEQRAERLDELRKESDQLELMSAVAYAEKYGVELMNSVGRNVADTFFGGGVSVRVTLDPCRGEGWWRVRTRHESHKDSAGLLRLLIDAGIARSGSVATDQQREKREDVVVERWNVSFNGGGVETEPRR
jgi:hypothetical protein